MKTLDEVLKENEKLNADLKSANDQLASSGSMLNDRTTEVAALNGFIADGKKVIEETQAKLNTAQAEIVTLKAAVTDLTARNADLTAKNADVNKFMASEFAKRGISITALKDAPETRDKDAALLEEYASVKDDPRKRAEFLTKNESAINQLLMSPRFRNAG